MTRLYLGGFKYSHRQEPALPFIEELTTRFGNVQDVEPHEHYVHFSLPSADSETVKKLKAKYNGATWKGSKVRLELAKPKKEISVSSDSDEKKVKKVRRLVRHCRDMGVVCDVSGKVRRGWVRSKGGRHVMQEIKIRKPDGKVKTIDLNALYKKNILTSFPTDEQQQEGKLLKNIWSTHGYDLEPTITKAKQETKQNDRFEEMQELHDKEEIHLTETFEVKEETRKIDETKNVCKWKDAFNAAETVSFSLFPTPEIPKTPERVIQEKPGVQTQQHEIDEPQENNVEKRNDLRFATNLPNVVDSIINNFVNHKIDINNWKRTIRPLLRKDIKQQRKQHLRTFRKATSAKKTKY